MELLHFSVILGILELIVQGSYLGVEFLPLALCLLEHVLEVRVSVLHRPELLEWIGFIAERCRSLKGRLDLLVGIQVDGAIHLLDRHRLFGPLLGDVG